MRVRLITTALGVTVTLLAAPACSTSTEHRTASSTRSASPDDTVWKATVLSSAALQTRLLDQDDLGSGYVRKPERPAQRDDVTVVGCPALSELGGNAATGTLFPFLRAAKTSFTYEGSSLEISEELYSDNAAKLSSGIERIFGALNDCPTYQLVAGGTPIDVAAKELPAPRGLGDERWSQLLTFSAAGRSTVVKQTAIRDGSLLLIVSGSPALVDRHLGKALDKVTGLDSTVVSSPRNPARW
ncbi:hypothetical protein H8N00_07565 [Streptomyces sp. AC563]|uniref:hypothetical protein n=1 Tax=Streptomyces buecherae TaxID=2763006 RepID=UPI00164D124B|nr:hypothetical protein [Streptomyces buecherae]MBC3988747.1 hypothetical protein [Streptomyces buecherae]